eukprot:900765-Prymnesium_polylepis.1
MEVDSSATFQSGHACVLQSEKPSFVTTHDRRGTPSVYSMPALTHVDSSTRIIIPAWSNWARGLSVKAVVRVASTSAATGVSNV